MAPIQAPVLFTETRLDLTPASVNSTVVLPCSDSSSYARSPKRAKHSHDSSTALDEASFARQHLATASSIFFRRQSRSPRVFLWRVLDDRSILEVQAVDLTQDKNAQGDPILTLRFSFESAIRPFGVAFADPDEKDALVVFVVTEAGQLFTLTLKREMWIDKRRTETNDGTEHWCKMFSPSAFSFRTPYRLFALDALNLVVSLQDGGLLKLQRSSGDDGTRWRDTFFTEGGWSSTLRGLIPFKSHNTIRFGGQELEPNTAAAVLLSPDQKHLLTIGLDHILRAWNLQTGRIDLQTDILGENEITDKKVQYLIGAEQTQLLQIIDTPGSNGVQYSVITYSPKQHQFKIWGILDAESGLAGVRDETDGLTLVPPFEDLLDTSVWSIEEFYFVRKHHWRETDLWVRARSGPISKLYNLKFDLTASVESLQSVWSSNWVEVDGGSLTSARLSRAAPETTTDPWQELNYNSLTEEWLAFFFHPGRFTDTVLQAALGAYARPAKLNCDATGAMKPLKQRICDMVTLTAQKQNTRTQASGETFESTVAIQWRVFFSLVRDMVKRQTEPMSLVYDFTNDLPWVIVSDFVSPIRLCSDIEVLTLNSSAVRALSQSLNHPLSAVVKSDYQADIARLLSAARGLRSILPNSLSSTFRNTITDLVLQEPSEEVPVRISTFDEVLGLCAQVSDEDYNNLTEAINEFGGYDALDDNLFHAVLELLTQQMRGLPYRQNITRYGARTLSRGAQETVALAVDVLSDLLVLVTFLALELDQADLSPQLHVGDIFVELTTQLKEHLLLDWLANTLRLDHAVARHRKRRSSIRAGSGSLMDDSMTEDMNAEQEPVNAQTVMESVFIGDWSSIMTPQNEPASSLLTYWSRAWTYGSDLGNHYDELAAHILAHLIKSGDLVLAEEFEKFVKLTPWSGYVKGRLAILRGEYQTAATLFKKSSFGLALSHFDANDTSPSLLLLPHEKNSFSDGLAPYYAHIITLFQSVNAHSYIIDFADLGLQSVVLSSSPTAEQESQRSELQARLFAACIATSRFDEAYASLNDMPPPLRRANLSSLLVCLLSESNASYATGILKRIPFTQTYSDADAILESLAAKTLVVATGQGARYHKALYALRVSRGDMRGAATALYSRIVHLRSSTERVADPESDESRELLRCYLALINCLATVDTSQAWIFAESKVIESQSKRSTSLSKGLDFGKRGCSLPLDGKMKEGKERKVLTIVDVRAMYQQELDHIEAVSAGRYAFDGQNGADVMDVL